jgi:hypothetical protein
MSNEQKQPPQNCRDESAFVAGAIIGLTLGAAAAGAAWLGAWLAVGEAIAREQP